MRRFLAVVGILAVLGIVGVALAWKNAPHAEAVAVDAAALEAARASGSAAATLRVDRDGLFPTTLAEARALWEEPELAAARRALEAALAGAGGTADEGALHALLAVVCRRQRDADAAMEHGRRAAELLPASSAAHHVYARAIAESMRTGGMFAALRNAGPWRAELRTAIELDPTNVEARLEELLFYAFVPQALGGDPARADELFAELDEHDRVRSIALRARMLQHREELDAAAAALEAALGERPDEPELLLARGDLRVALDEVDLADEDYARAARARPAESAWRAVHRRANAWIDREGAAPERVRLALELLDEYAAGAPRGDYMPAQNAGRARPGSRVRAPRTAGRSGDGVRRRARRRPERGSRRAYGREAPRGGSGPGAVDSWPAMTFSPERRRHQRVRSHLSHALDLPEGEREAYLSRSLGEGETLREALELLREVEGLDDFLERPLDFDRGEPGDYAPPLPDEVAGFRIERVLGWGAMGVVYLARQSTPRRAVALKLLRLDAATPSAARRFHREADALARLAHPGIARVYGAGLADLGAGAQPYIAMEYVRGVPLDEYASARNLTTRQRVELVLRIADAVDHAHRHGVLHRDLKPGNVLVDESGEVRVLDFGVARVATDEELGATLTSTGQLVGTVAYMAPEQARGAAVDERADLYALATILYELLTDVLPVDVRGRLTHDALRVVADEPGVPLRRRRPDLGRDLDAIVSCALAHEKSDRFRSVRAFGDDLRRWLEGRPVRVRPPGGVGRLGRFVIRNRGLSAVVALVLLSSGAAVALVISARLDAQRLRLFSQVLRDRLHLDRLAEAATTHWPDDPARRPAIEAWIGDARDLLARLPDHRATLDWLRSSRRGWSGELPGGEYRAEWLTTTEDLVTGLGDLGGPAGTLEVMRQRRDDLLQMERALEDRAPTWQAAAARVAADPRFEGYALEPQAGLVPLGPDPASGLEEFGVWRFTGRTPERSASGRLEVGEDTGVVLVLIPGGEVVVGAQDVDPTQPNFDERSRPNSDEYQNEGPTFTVRLDPFLLSKYEMTQAQWSSAFDFNPSDWEIGAKPFADEPAVTARHPVESVSWEQALTYLPRIGLTLPTEAQWETAARAGADHVYMVGPGWRDLIGHANARNGPPEVPGDEYRLHMPVGSFAPNGFGLHDVMGNVWELCMDIYKVPYHSCEHDDGTGLVQAEFDGDVSRRGPGCAADLRGMRVAKREMRLYDDGEAGTGLRPARWLDPGARVQAVEGALLQGRRR